MNNIEKEMNKSLGNTGILWALLIIGCWFLNLYIGITLELSFSNPWAIGF
jgi:hypothetical protein